MVDNSHASRNQVRIMTLTSNIAALECPLNNRMEIHTFFPYLLVILLTARIFAELASRFQTPPVIGEIIAGVLLGPSLLGWIEPVEVSRLLAEIGIILLLFEVGLDTDVRRLARAVIVALPGFFYRSC